MNKENGERKINRDTPMENALWSSIGKILPEEATLTAVKSGVGGYVVGGAGTAITTAITIVLLDIPLLALLFVPATAVAGAALGTVTFVHVGNYMSRSYSTFYGAEPEASLRTTDFIRHARENFNRNEEDANKSFLYKFFNRFGSSVINGLKETIQDQSREALTINTSP